MYTVNSPVEGVAVDPACGDGAEVVVGARVLIVIEISSSAHLHLEFLLAAAPVYTCISNKQKIYEQDYLYLVCCLELTYVFEKEEINNIRHNNNLLTDPKSKFK